MPIRVVIVEDHPVVLSAVSERLKAQANIEVVGTADHGSNLFKLVRQTSPDVVVLDIGMSEGHFEPITAVRSLRERYPQVRVLVFTGYEDTALVRGLIGAGAQGYVLKSDGLSLQMPDAVRAVHAGRRFYSPSVTDKYMAYDQAQAFSDKELAVLRLLALGLSNVAIGQELGLAEKTICNYLSQIYNKLEVGTDESVNRRVMALNKARDLGLLPGG